MEVNEVTKMEFDLRLARARWWENFANTKANKSREVYHGCDCTPEKRFTEDELVEDAMNTAKRHLELAQELLESVNGSQDQEDD